MAFGLKQWGAIALTGMATAAVLLLPLEEGNTSAAMGDETVDAASTYARGLQLELNALNDALKRTRWLDSLHLEMARASDSNGVTVGWPSFGPDETARLDARWAGDVEAAIRTEVVETRSRLRSEGGSAPGADVAVFWVPGEQGGHPEARVSWGGSSEVYAGELDGRSYCMVIHPFREGDFRRSLLSRPGFRLQPGQADWYGAEERAVGPCDYWLRYGAPGSRIRAWLADGALRFAALRSMPEADRLTLGAHHLMFIGPRLNVDPPLGLASCLAGEDSACERLLFEPETLAWATNSSSLERAVRSGMMPEDYVGSGLRYIGGSDYFMPALFSTLERDFGREAFRAFWTSDEAPEVAFRAAFGLEPAEWLRGWAGPLVGDPLDGPGVRMATLGLLLPTLLGTLFISALVAHRRRIA